MAVDLNNLKTQIKSILDAANDSGATYDLSTNMSKRVKRVLKVNPSVIPIQSTLLPYVTIHTSSKSIEHADVARNQLSAKRRSEISFEIVGVVLVNNVTNINEDPADEEIEKLMENIEEVIRRSDTLNDSVDWTNVTDVSYHTAHPGTEQTHLRIGILTLNVTKFY